MYVDQAPSRPRPTCQQQRCLPLCHSLLTLPPSFCLSLSHATEGSNSQITSAKFSGFYTSPLSLLRSRNPSVTSSAFSTNLPVSADVICECPPGCWSLLSCSLSGGPRGAREREALYQTGEVRERDSLCSDHSVRVQSLAIFCVSCNVQGLTEGTEYQRLLPGRNLALKLKWLAKFTATEFLYWARN